VTTQQTQAPRAPSTLSQMDPANTRLHFVGVGGVSMQALALWCRAEGFEVSGCDRSEFDATRLTAAGIEVCAGHDAAHAHGKSLVVHSMAVPADHPELQAARAAGTRVVRRIELLGELFRRRRAIGITGTHGKSTTTGMAATLLLALDPESSVQLGASLPAIEGGFRYGAGEWLVAEVDESDPGFADLEAEVALVTNLDDDHVAGEYDERRNYYASYDELQAATRRFAGHAQRLLYCRDWVALPPLVADHPGAASYGFAADADYRIADVDLRDHSSRFVLHAPGLGALTVELAVPGKHNVSNAAAAVAAVHLAGFDPRPALPALATFRGVGRRWQSWGERDGALIIDDYAHHPTEVAAMLEVARHTGRRVRAVLQPHRWVRTARQWPELAAAAAAADEVLVLDIYGAGEKPIANVSSALIVERLREQGVEARGADIGSATAYLAGSLAPNDLVITLGAGDVWRVAAALADGRVDAEG